MIRVVVFDAYGTLLDVHSAIARHAARVGKAHAAVSALWRQKQLEATWILSAVGDYAPFEELTDRALGHALAAHGIADAALRADLLAAYRALAAFADAAPALHAVHARGLRTATFSNGSPEMLDAGVAAAGLASLLDEVLSVHPLRCFKPAPRVYRYATEHLGCQPHEVAFISANGWDAFGAARFGWRTFWLNRSGGPTEYWLDRLATILPGLDALPDALA
jgi:2-haloacid dehalogenase